MDINGCQQLRKDTTQIHKESLTMKSETCNFYSPYGKFLKYVFIY